MSDTSIHKYNLIFKSDPKLLDFKNIALNNIIKATWNSDIFSFFAYGELYFNDDIGLISDGVFFIEGLSFEFKLGFESEDGATEYLGHDYTWGEHQIQDTALSNAVTGTNMFILMSKAYMDDPPQSKIWKQRSISDIVREIAIQDYGINSDKIFISETDGKDNWNQFNQDNKDFIGVLSDVAVSKNNPKSPYFTFFNSNGDFYFMTIEDMFKTQQPVYEYTMEFVLGEDEYRTDILKEFDLMFGGLPINYEDYYKEAKYVDKTGAFNSADFKIEEHFYKVKKDKILIRKEYTTNPTDFLDLGIVETPQDLKNMKGKVNSLYRDSSTSYRMTMVVHPDPHLVTGKLIKINVESKLEAKQISTEYSGIWLIIDDNHRLDSEGMPYTQIIVSKSGINLDKNHPMINDFL